MKEYLEALLSMIKNEAYGLPMRLQAAELYLKAQLLVYMKSEG